MTPFGPELWLCDGPVMTGAAGFRFPTRMGVARLPDGGLWVWSPVALTPDVRGAVDALGPVRHLVAPNTLHTTFLAEWVRTYPGAKVHAAPGLTADDLGIAIDAVLADAPHLAWGGATEQVIVRGNRITTEVVFFHRPSATVLITDLVQHLPSDWYRGWRGIVARLDRMTAAEPSVPRKFRLATTNRRAARAAVDRILAWPAERLVMAHGPPVEANASDVLRRAFGWLVR